VPPKETPEAITPPAWLPAVFAGLVVFVIVIILAKRRGQVELEVD
jgi:hypothetical protein